MWWQTSVHLPNDNFDANPTMGSKSSEADRDTKQPTVTFRDCFAEEPTDGKPFDPFPQAHAIQNPDKQTYLSKWWKPPSL